VAMDDAAAVDHQNKDWELWRVPLRSQKNQSHRGVMMNDTTSCMRVERLADLEAVKWVTGTDRQTAKVERLTAEQIAEIADIEMYQPYPLEPSTWVSVKPNKRYSVVMAIVATEASERGAALVNKGETCTDNQIDGMAIGCHGVQQRRLKFQTGECSEGCSLSNIRFRTHLHELSGVEVEQICRHTMSICESCLQIPTDKRMELLERLLLESRELSSCREYSNLPSERVQWIWDRFQAIVAELDGKQPVKDSLTT
jgi:hypothetical protein